MKNRPITRRIAIILLAICGISSTLILSTSVNAGTVTPPALSLSATTATDIFAGDSVTFSYSYSCSYQWQNGSLQPFDDNGNRGNPVSMTTPIFPTDIGTQGFIPPPSTGTFSLTFATAGTYNIDARVTADLVVLPDSDVTSAGLTPPCNVANATAKVVVVVRDRPTTTTTTVAAAITTVEEVKEVLPQTGSDNTGALVAISVGLAGVAVLISRRRLLNS